MPGIAGFINPTGCGDNRAQIEAMIRSMQHEDFYSSGTVACEPVGLSLGWVCHSGSFCDCMPVWNEARNICLVFVGDDLFDGCEERRLRAAGHSFPGGTAEWLVHLYEEQGLGFLRHLNGWFCGLLADIRSGDAWLFNDRYGLGRVYVHEGAHGFHFASEAKALLRVLPQTRSFDPDGFAEFLSCGCPLRNRTLFKGISLLPGGACWRLGPDGRVSKDAYFDRADWEQQAPLNATAYLREMESTWTGLLPPYFRGRSTVGMSLTGGVDGRLIMAWAPREPGALPCYTFASPYRDSADVRIARQVAAACGQPHRAIRVDGSFLETFPSLAEKTVLVSDGAMDVSGAVELYVNRLAREVGSVRLSGNYGQEILRSSVAFRPRPLRGGWLAPELEQRTADASRTYAAERSSPTLSFVAFKQVPWHHFARLAVEQSQLVMRSPYLDNALVALAYRAPCGGSDEPADALRLAGAHCPELGAIPTDRGRVANSMGLRGQLRRAWTECVVKAEYTFDYGMPPWLAAANHLLGGLHAESIVLGRHKFYHFRVWYRDRLSAYVREVLLDPVTLRRPYLNRKRVERMVVSHTAGWANHTLEIHKLLTCEIIEQQLLRPGGPPPNAGPGHAELVA